MNRVILGILCIYICVFSGNALSAFDFPTHLNFMLKNLHAQAQTNNKPVVTDDHITLSEDELGLLNLLGNDNDLDKDALKIVSVSALFGEVELMPNGQVKYQPPHNFSGQDKITYWLSDGRSNALSGQAYITVNSINDVPVANNDAATVIANSKITIEVLDNDTDVDGDVLTVKQASAMYGIVLNNGSSIEYQPNMGFDGADVIHYTIADKSGAQSSAQVNMTVLKENKSAPVIIGQKPLFMDEDTTLELTLDHINYIDSDSLHGDIVLELAEGENYTLNGLSLTPKQHFSGELFVPVTLFDAKHRSLEYMLLITVNDVNDSPQAGQILLESVKDEKFTLFMSAMMHDPDITFGPHGLNDPRLEQFKYIFSKQAVREDHGGWTNKGGRFLQVLGAKNGVVEYTPPTGFIGRDHVFFFVYDDKGAVSGRGDIVLDIKEHTSSPVIIRSNTLTDIREDQPFQLSINDLHIRYKGSMNRHSDLTLVVDDTLGPYTYDPVTELITIDPLYEETSLNVFVQVSDGVSNSNTFVVPVSLISVNEAPTVFDLEETVTNLQGIEIDIRSELVVDPEASKSPSLFDQFTYQFVIPEGSIDHKTDGGQFVRVPGKPHGVFKYIPNPNFVKDTVSFWVTDNGGVRSNMGTLIMNAPVLAIPHRPSASLNMGEIHVTWAKVDFATHYMVQEHWQWSDFSSSVKEYRSDTNQISLIDKVNGYSKYSIKACHLTVCSQWSELSLPTKSFVTTPNSFATASSEDITNATLTAITAPTAANVGTLAGNAGVNGGAASYRIPMPLPPGRNGVQPSVSLSYSSRSGNGIAGVGFALSAGSQISRCSATYAQDGFTQNPQYNDNDKLCLDGQRLISVSGVYGQDNTVYRTELESLVRVTQSGQLNSGNVSFTAEYANGTTAYFGQDVSSRLIHNGKTQTNAWLIGHQHDATANNYIHYSYNDIGTYGAGEKLLTAITYTGNSATEKGQQTVTFTYEGSSAPRNGYMAGGYFESTQRLKSISTAANTLTLNYKTSRATERELLSSVQLCVNGDCLPATSFAWQDAAMTVKNEHLDIQTLTTIIQNAPIGDRNGDGARDWPGKYINAEGVSVNNTHPTNSCVYNGGAVQNCHQKTADLNLDGYSDQLDLVISGTGRNLQYTLNTQNGGEATHTTNIQVAALANILAVQDYNGDSYPDVLILNKFISTHADQVLIYYHSGDISAPYRAANQSELMTLDKNIPEMPHTTTYNIVPMGDLDGNGLADFYVTDSWDRSKRQTVFGQAPINAFYFTHASGNTVSLQRGTGLSDGGSYGSYNQYTRFYFFADINGDGLQDWLGWVLPNNRNSNKTRLYVRYNEGGSFAAAQDTGLNMPPRRVIHKEYLGEVGDEVSEFSFEPKYANALQIGDIDNDGKEEILYPATVAANHCIEATIDSYFTKGEVCGEQFDSSALEQVGVGPSAFVRSLDTRYDRSIYQYKAIRLSNGAFSSYTTGFYGSRNHSMLVDGQGDGLVDLIFNYGYRCYSSGTLGCNFSTAPPSGFAQGKVNISRNYGSGSGNTGSDYAPSDMLTSVTNGVGHQSGWAYRPLSTGLDTPIAGAKNLYEKGTDYTQGYQNFASSMYVVTTFSQDNGIGGKRYKDYAYRGAVQNTQGRGFMGFERIIEQDRSLGVVSQSDFEQVFPRSGKLVRQARFLAADFGTRTERKLGDEFTESSAIGFNEYEWRINTNHNVTDLTQVYLGSKTQIQRDINDKTEVTRTGYSAVNIDACGNVTNSSNIIQDSWGTYKTTSSSTVSTDASCANTGTWWPNKLDSTAVTKAAVSNRHASDPLTGNTLDKTSTIKSTFTEYATNRKPTIVKVEGLEGTAKSGEGSTTTTVFNIYGLPTSVSKTAKVRNSAGKWVDQTRPVTITYSKEGKTAAADGYFPLTVTNAKGHQVITHVDPSTGQPTQTKQQVGASAWVTSTIQYDNLNRPYSSKVDGAPIQYTAMQSVVGDAHAPTNAVVMMKQLSAGAPESRIYQDKLGRTLRVATQSFDGSWAYQDTRYDGLGRTTFESMPYKANGTAVGTRYSGFDVLGRPTTKTVAQQCTSTSTGLMTVTYGYSGLDTTIDVSENCNNLVLGQMSRTYNSLKQLVATKDALNGWTYYGYNSLGLPAVIQDANGNQIKATYNALGHKTSVNDPNQGASTFAYNGFGELQAEGRPDNVTLTFLTDTLGRVTKRTATGESDLHYGFDAGNGYGQLTSSSGNGVSHSYVFDGYGRPTTHTVSGDGKSYTNTTFYDGNYGRVKGVRYPNNLTLEYTYNSLGYQESIKNVANDYVYQTVESQDILGNITQHALGNGLAQTTLYSAANGQMTSVTTKDGNDQVMSLQYTGYDGFGNLNAMTVSTGSIGNQHTFSESYVYDDLHRLKSNSVNGIETIHYTYDALGNLTKKSDYASEYKYDTSLSGFSGGGSNAVKKVYKNGTWVGFSYDKRGNMIKGDGLTSATYNAMDKPISLTKHGITTKFMYGPDHMRYKQTKGSSTFTYYAGGYEEDVKNGKTTWRAYIGDVAVVSQGEGESATIRYTHRDRLGSARLFTDKNGNVLAERNFDPFGKPKEVSGEQKLPAMLGDMDAATTMRGFTDHEHLDEQQLIHMNGRVYDYNLGRFMSVDPIIFQPGNSQAINPYSYIMNNPLAGTDPTGYIPLIPALIWAYAAYETASDAADTYESYQNGDISGGDVAGAVVSSAVENTVGKKLRVAKEGVQKMRKAFKGDKPDTNVQNSKNASNTDGGTKKNGAENSQSASGSKPDSHTEIGSQGETQKVRHYTNKASADKIEESGTIKASDNNRVYVEDGDKKPLSPKKAEAKHKIKQGKGNSYVETNVNKSDIEMVKNPLTGKKEMTIKGDVKLKDEKIVHRK